MASHKRHAEEAIRRPPQQPGYGWKRTQRNERHCCHKYGWRQQEERIDKRALRDLKNLVLLPQTPVGVEYAGKEQQFKREPGAAPGATEQLLARCLALLGNDGALGRAGCRQQCCADAQHSRNAGVHGHLGGEREVQERSGREGQKTIDLSHALGDPVGSQQPHKQAQRANCEHFQQIETYDLQAGRAAALERYDLALFRCHHDIGGDESVEQKCEQHGQA